MPTVADPGRSEEMPATPRRRGETAWARDARLAAAPTLPMTKYLAHAVRKSGRNPLSIAREYVRLSRGRGRLSVPEYVQYGVYDPSLSDDEKSRFLSEALHWPIAHRCNDITWQAATEDKWLCAQILERAGLPAPPTLAVIDTTDRTFPRTRTIRTGRELRELLVSHCRAGVPVFCKPNRAVGSYGAFVVDAAEPNRLHLDGEGWMEYDACLGELIGAKPYLVQPVQRNHPFLSRYTDRLATVRVYLLRADSGVKLPFVVLKMAAPEHVADNYWRSGNLACDLDPATGSIRSGRTKNALGTTDHAAHPDTGAQLVGETLPTWDRIVGLAHECSNIFAPVRYQSMDIAILEDGPSVIEVNSGGAFNLVQFAGSRGFLADDVLEFFRGCGYKG